MVNSPFAVDDEGEVIDKMPWYNDPTLQKWLLTLIRYLLVVMAAFMLYRLVLRPLADMYMKQKASVIPVKSQPAAVPPFETETEEEKEEEVPPRRKRRNITYERNMKGLQEMAKEDPALVAMIVRSWMKQND